MGDGRDVNVEGKSTSEPRIVVEASSTSSRNLVLCSQDAVMSESWRVGDSGMFLRSVCRVKLTPPPNPLQGHHDPNLFAREGSSPLRTRSYNLRPTIPIPTNQDRAPPPPANDDEVEMVPDWKNIDEKPRRWPGRSSTNHRGWKGSGDDTDKVPSEPETTNEPMKTMAELAAEHAERSVRSSWDLRKVLSIQDEASGLACPAKGIERGWQKRERTCSARR